MLRRPSMPPMTTLWSATTSAMGAVVGSLLTSPAVRAAASCLASASALGRSAGGVVVFEPPLQAVVATLSLLLTDIGVALLTPAADGKVWQLGGACLTDALFIGPPFVMIVFYGLLDCRSSWVFCSQKCVSLGRCRFGMDGKGEAGQCRCGKDGPALTEQQVR